MTVNMVTWKFNNILCLCIMKIWSKKKNVLEELCFLNEHFVDQNLQLLKSNFASNNRLIVKVHVILVIYTDMWIIAVW